MTRKRAQTGSDGASFRCQTKLNQFPTPFEVYKLFKIKNQNQAIGLDNALFHNVARMQYDNNNSSNASNTSNDNESNQRNNSSASQEQTNLQAQSESSVEQQQQQQNLFFNPNLDFQLPLSTMGTSPQDLLPSELSETQFPNEAQQPQPQPLQRQMSQTSEQSLPQAQSQSQVQSQTSQGKGQRELQLAHQLHLDPSQVPVLKQAPEEGDFNLDLSVLFDDDGQTFPFYEDSSATGTQSPEEVQVAYQNIEEFRNTLLQQEDTRSPVTKWTAPEEVILQGVVVDCNLVYGTQASWKEICRCYNLATEKYCNLNNIGPLRRRSSCALKKHYRMMHKRIKEGQVERYFWYKVYHTCWLSTAFNAGNRLIDYSKV